MADASQAETRIGTNESGFRTLRVTLPVAASTLTNTIHRKTHTFTQAFGSTPTVLGLSIQSSASIQVPAIIEALTPTGITVRMTTVAANQLPDADVNVVVTLEVEN